MLAVLGAALSTLGAPAAARAADAERVSSFLLPVIPDTQFYSRYAAPDGGEQFQRRFGSEPFSAQTAWIARHSRSLNVPFVPHLGDVVDRHGRAGEWGVATAAMQRLTDRGVPYSILAGNHDVADEGQLDTEATLADENFLRFFGVEARRAQAGATWIGADPTGFSSAHRFTAEGRSFMVLALHWKVSDATIAWAKRIIAEHPTLPVILTTHQLLNVADDGESPRETAYGLELWEELIRSTDQIFLTLNGHYHGASRITKVNDFGNAVEQVVIDYQMAYQGGNGYLGLFEFDFTNRRIRAETVSPWVTTKPEETLVPEFDRAVLTGRHQRYAIELDFDARFRRFNPEFSKDAVAPGHTSLAEKATRALLRAYDEPAAVVPRRPAGPDDHPKVDGTLAHWRFGGRADGTVVAPGDTVPDVTGRGNTLTRAPLSESGPGAEAGDVVVTTRTHPLSSDPAAVCFANADRRTGRLSYLRTAADAPLNDERFADGYTIETFAKIAPSWTADANMWMAGLAHTGDRRAVPGVPESDVELGASVFTMSFSNLRELQWSVLGASPGAGETTNWSGEVFLDRWMHVAAVFDRPTRTTTLYVDGAPVLRNVVGDADGIAAIEDLPWTLGAGTYDGAPNGGWNGCLGETRLVDRPLPSSQWLTARVSPPPAGDGDPGGGDSAGGEPPAAPVGGPAAPAPSPAAGAAPSGGGPAAVAPLAAVAGRGPRIAGTARVGRRLTATPGAWSVATGVRFSFQWLRDGRAIPGATGATYVIGAADVRRRIAVRVTATAPGRSASAVSGRTAVVARIRPAVRISVAGRRAGGATVTVRVRAPGVTPSGTVTLRVAGRRAGPARALRRGVATIRLRGRRPGTTTLTASYGGSRVVAPGRSPATRVRLR